MPKMYREADGQWVVPGKQSRKAERVDIPSGFAELADWLNINARAPESLVESVEDIPEADEAFFEKATLREPEKPSVALMRSSYEATDIEDFILNRASIDQVGNILSRIGTRFAELIKDKGLTGLLD